jgi:hypothetical protein
MPDLSIGGIVSDAVEVERAQNSAIRRFKAAWGVRSAEEGMQSGSHTIKA